MTLTAAEVRRSSLQFRAAVRDLDRLRTYPGDLSSISLILSRGEVLRGRPALDAAEYLRADPSRAPLSLRAARYFSCPLRLSGRCGQVPADWSAADLDIWIDGCGSRDGCPGRDS